MGVKKLQKLIDDSADLCSIEDVIEFNGGPQEPFPVDISNFIYGFKYAVGDTYVWIERMVRFCQTLKMYFRPVIVFDGPTPKWKIVKSDREKKRIENKRKFNQVYDSLEETVQLNARYIQWKGIQNSIATIPAAAASSSSSSFAYDAFQDIVFSVEEVEVFKNWKEDEMVMVESIQTDRLLKASRENISTSPEDYLIIERTCQLLQIEFVHATWEADSVLKHFRTALTNDRDPLLQGVETLVSITYSNFVHIVDKRSKVFKVFQLKKVHAHLEINQDRFVEYCFLLGCDFSQGLPGIKVGRVKDAFKEHQTIEGIIANSRFKPKQEGPLLTQWNSFLTNFCYAKKVAIDTIWDKFALLTPEQRRSPFQNFDCTDYGWRLTAEFQEKLKLIETQETSNSSSSTELVAPKEDNTECNSKTFIETALKEVRQSEEEEEGKRQQQEASSILEIQTQEGAKNNSLECDRCVNETHLTNTCNKCGNEQCLQCVKQHTGCRPCCFCTNKYKRQAFEAFHAKKTNVESSLEELKQNLQRYHSIEDLLKGFGCRVSVVAELPLSHFSEGKLIRPSFFEPSAKKTKQETVSFQ